MEDAHTIVTRCAGLDGHSFVAVYDGHGGALCAEYAGQNMMRHITETEEYKAYAEAPVKDTKVSFAFDLCFLRERTGGRGWGAGGRDL